MRVRVTLLLALFMVPASQSTLVNGVDPDDPTQDPLQHVIDATIWFVDEFDPNDPPAVFINNTQELVRRAIGSQDPPVCVTGKDDYPNPTAAALAYLFAPPVDWDGEEDTLSIREILFNGVAWVVTTHSFIISLGEIDCASLLGPPVIDYESIEIDPLPENHHGLMRMTWPPADVWY